MKQGVSIYINIAALDEVYRDAKCYQHINVNIFLFNGGAIFTM